MEQLTTFLTMNMKDEKAEKDKSHTPENPNKWIGMCYVPMQVWEATYDDDTAFDVGTIFPSLNKPFLGGGR